MIQVAKNELFGYFVDIGLSDWLEVAYYDKTKYCAGLAYHISCITSFKSHFWIIQTAEDGILVIFFQFGRLVRLNFTKCS